MTKLQKQQIENMLEMHEKAHDAVKKALDTGNQSIALTLLEQCQDSAIQAGGIIEASLGQDFVTVGLLEDYCEQIYQIYEAIRQGLVFNVSKTCKNLRKDLIRIRNSVKNDVRVKSTVVFLPYKASMWDSLESVWKAADEDPNCDAYVVPIPYFDKNPDGSFREMHYEGDEYPKYVPITSWEEYDIVAEHPDMIFIHNPYDEFNYVTSVAPMYYSKELKKHTELLVYIPYFILEDIEPNKKESVKNLEHFCTVPAVVHADKVIVQSKEWRQVYIDVMAQTMGNDTRRIWEKKILALGSPKLDKIYSTTRNDIEIPKEWLGITEKADGSRKKIVFYNTSVSALLQHGEKMLKKLKFVFGMFKGNQKEVALLWRPHPLIKATIASMRPQLWIEYEKIVKEYIAEGWGIYDDSADMNRAIQISDAYYGDPSSIVKLYQGLNRPVMLQNVEADAADSAVDTVYFFSICQYADKLWFVSTARYFMSINKLTGEAAFVHWIERQPWEKQSALLGAMFEYEGKIYWIGQDKQDLHEYNIVNNEYTHWTLPEIRAVDLKSCADIFLYKGKLWVCRKLAPYIVTIDLHEKKCELYPKLCGKQNGGYDVHGDLQIKFFVQTKRWLYVFREQNMVMKLDLCDFLCEYITTPEELSGAINVVWANEAFYVLTKDRTVYLWDEKLNTIEKIYHCSDERQTFGRMGVTKHRIFLLPHMSEQIIVIDLTNGKKAEQVKYPEDFQYAEFDVGKYGKCVEDEEYIWYANRCGNYVLRIDKQREELEWIKIGMPSIYEEWYFRKDEGEKIPWFNENKGSLGRLMDVRRNEEIKDADRDEMVKIGAAVWKSLNNEA